MTLAPRFAPAWLDLGVAQAESGALDESIASLSEAQRLQPDDVAVAFSLSQSLLAAGQAQRAVRLLSDANASRPGEPQLMLALAQALRQADRADESVALLEQLMAIDCQNADVVMELGNAFREQDRTAQALSCYQQLLTLNPLHLGAHDALARLLFESSEQHYLSSYQRAIAHSPRSAPLRQAYAGWLIRAERYADAEAELLRVLRLGCADEQTHRQLAMAHANQGQNSAALEQFQAAVNLAPQHAPARRDLARMLLMLDDAPAALQHVLEAMRLAPHDQEALAYLGLCWRLLGDEREAQLNDYAALVRSYRIDVPAGHDNLDSFNRELLSALEQLHVSTTHPPDQTLRGGTQTYGDLFAQRLAPVQSVREQIERCVHSYICDMADDPRHPLFARKSDDFRFAASWSCQLKQQGFHTNHVHPKGWISSCYYVSLPDAVKNDADQQGWLKFGESNLRLGDKEKIAHMVRPEEGLLVLFPSYMFHGTVPFDSPQARTTIAFDVVPESADGC